jgi:hypothetical protein
MKYWDNSIIIEERKRVQGNTTKLLEFILFLILLNYRGKRDRDETSNVMDPSSYPSLVCAMFETSVCVRPIRC